MFQGDIHLVENGKRLEKSLNHKLVESLIPDFEFVIIFRISQFYSATIAKTLREVQHKSVFL